MYQPAAKVHWASRKTCLLAATVDSKVKHVVWQVTDDHLRAILSNAATDVEHAPELLAALKKGKPEQPKVLLWKSMIIATSRFCRC